LLFRAGFSVTGKGDHRSGGQADLQWYPPFLLEDAATLQPDVSRNSLRQQCKDRAYELVRRSNAWSRLVAETFPDAVRLSIHPQPCHSEKIGFHLIRTTDNWLTPWHGAAVEVADGVVLVKRWEAEKLRASLVRRHGRPSHFVAPHLQLKECS
jgi:pyoverdine/dityrosine biosynthesis protein Dit1